MNTEFEEQEVYLLLDFESNETATLNQGNEYMRVMNLDQINPMVQLGDDIFEGIYEDTIGTNVFFEEVEDGPQKSNIFESKSLIHLKYKLHQTKLLKLKKVGTTQKNPVKMNPSEAVNVVISESYKEMLEKYENGTLNIEDYVVEKPAEDELTEVNKIALEQHTEISEWFNEDYVIVNEEPPRMEEEAVQYEGHVKTKQVGTEEEVVTEQVRSEKQITTEASSKNVPLTSIHDKYIKLQKYLQQPITRPTAESYITEKSMFSTSKCEFANWKDVVLKNLKECSFKFNAENFKIEDIVYIERSIASGIIEPFNEKSRVFTNREKQKLLSFDNFINVSPFIQLLMLKDYLYLFKYYMKDMLDDELNVKEPDCFSILEKYEALKDFKSQFKSSLMLHLQNVTGSIAVANLKLKVSEDKDFSDTDEEFDPEWENSLSDSDEDSEIN